MRTISNNGKIYISCQDLFKEIGMTWRGVGYLSKIFIQDLDVITSKQHENKGQQMAFIDKASALQLAIFHGRSESAISMKIALATYLARMPMDEYILYSNPLFKQLMSIGVSVEEIDRLSS